MQTLIINTDGGSRGNPGKAASAFVAFQNELLIFESSHYLGTATNNEAEYDGLITSLEWVLLQNPSQWEAITWQTDSLLMCNQVNKQWKIKEPRMLAKAQTAWNLLEKLPCPHTIKYVPREENTHADALVNQELDSQIA